MARLAPVLESRAQGAATAIGGAPPRRKLRLSPERRAALKLQGQYMGYLRGLKPREKTRVKALAAAKGVRAGVVLAKQLARA